MIIIHHCPLLLLHPLYHSQHNHRPVGYYIPKFPTHPYIQHSNQKDRVAAGVVVVIIVNAFGVVLNVRRPVHHHHKWIVIRSLIFRSLHDDDPYQCPCPRSYPSLRVPTSTTMTIVTRRPNRVHVVVHGDRGCNWGVVVVVPMNWGYEKRINFTILLRLVSRPVHPMVKSRYGILDTVRHQYGMVLVVFVY